MEPSLLVGDHVLINKFIYGSRRAGEHRSFPWLPARGPDYGDVVVLAGPRHHQHLIKRCVGLPGDTLAAPQDTLYVNRRRAVETYLQAPGSTTGLHTTSVPLDRYFFLGDHRTESRDSRSWGALTANHLVGQAFLVYWSEIPDDIEQPDKLTHHSQRRLFWLQRFRWNRIMKRVR